jgi:hypothetical protein
MERFNVIQDICEKLGLTQINNSWIETLGAHLNIPQLPGNDNYEQTVFVEAISNSEVSALPYRSLVGSVTQVGTDDPTLVILQNDFNVTFTIARSSTGVYQLSDFSTIITNIPGDLDKLYLYLGNPDGQQDEGTSAWVASTKYVLEYDSGISKLNFITAIDGVFTDGMLSRSKFELRLYN